MSFVTPIIVKYVKKNLDITKPCYSSNKFWQSVRYIEVPLYWLKSIQQTAGTGHGWQKCHFQSSMKTRAVNTKGQGPGIFLGYYKHDPPATFIEKIRKLEPKINYWNLRPRSKYVELLMRRINLSELSSWKVRRLAQLSSSEWVRIV